MAEQTATDIKLPVKVRREDLHSPNKGYSLRNAYGEAISGWGSVTMSERQAKYIAECVNQHATLLTENAELKARIKAAEKVIEFYGHDDAEGVATAYIDKEAKQ